MAIREFDLHKKEEPESLELLGVTEIAELIHQTAGWVRSQTRSRCKDPIPHIKRGRRLFFEEAKVLAWFRAGRVEKKTFPKSGR